MSGQRQMAWYLAGVGSWFLGAGSHSTLFPWLVAIDLGESAVRVGTAQMVSMLPVLFLMLVGGAFADRHDCRSLLIRLHASAAIPPLVLAAAIYSGRQSYATVLSYAVAMGLISAFVIPARESLLSRVAGGNVQRGVTLAILLQNVVQVGGIAVAGAANEVGATVILVAMSAAYLTGAVTSWRLAPAPPVPRSTATGRFEEIREGLRELVATRELLVVTGLSVAIGVLFLGPFLVGFPLLVRDLYGGSAPEIAGVNAAMMLGMMAGASGMLAIGGVRRHGRAMLCALVLGALMLLAVSLEPPLPFVYACVFLFGVGGGVATPAGRTLVQETAPPSHRARILSVYSLGFMGAAPFGSFLTGSIASASGPLLAIGIPAAIMLGVVALTMLATDAWSYTSRNRSEP